LVGIRAAGAGRRKGSKGFRFLRIRPLAVGQLNEMACQVRGELWKTTTNKRLALYLIHPQDQNRKVGKILNSTNKPKNIKIPYKEN
jgi:hypothetical protein